MSLALSLAAQRMTKNIRRTLFPPLNSQSLKACPCIRKVTVVFSTPNTTPPPFPKEKKRKNKTENFFVLNDELSGWRLNVDLHALFPIPSTIPK